MKKIVFSLLAIFAFSLSAMAQGQEVRRGPMTPPSPDQMVEMRVQELSSQLNLTPAQQEKIRKIIDKQVKEEMKAQEKMEQKRAKAEEKIMNVLTPDQRAKYGESRPTSGRMQGGPRRGPGRPDVNGRPHDGPRHPHDGPRIDRPDRPDAPGRPDRPEPLRPAPEDVPVTP